MYRSGAHANVNIFLATKTRSQRYESTRPSSFCNIVGLEALNYLRNPVHGPMNLVVPDYECGVIIMVDISIPDRVPDVFE